MAKVPEAWKNDKHCLSVWINQSEFNDLHKFASENNVKVSDYVRGIVVDAINDERDRQMIPIRSKHCTNERT